MCVCAQKQQVSASFHMHVGLVLKYCKPGLSLFPQSLSLTCLWRPWLIAPLSPWRWPALGRGWQSAPWGRALWGSPTKSTCRGIWTFALYPLFYYHLCLNLLLPSDVCLYLTLVALMLRANEFVCDISLYLLCIFPLNLSDTVLDFELLLLFYVYFSRSLSHQVCFHKPLIWNIYSWGGKVLWLLFHYLC